MKKKIIFMVINMNVGGTEKALLNMISEMPKEKYDITILMLEEYGGFLDSIPDDVHVEYVSEYTEIKYAINKPPKQVALNHFKKGKFIKGIVFSLITMLSKVTKRKSIFFKYLLKKVSGLKNEYDTAVAYAGPMDLISYFVAEKIKAKKKVQWIHFDITKVGFDKQFTERLYQKFDKIFVVSKEGQQKFNSMFPQLKDKSATFNNVVPSKQILKLADEGPGFDDDFDGIRILTVGRLSKEKGQDLVIPVLSELKKSGLNVKWYCIGEGKARLEYEKLIKEYDVENDFILLGSKVNPYSYMKQCDIYVQPSRHEGYCITLSEAKCFQKLIVATNFTGATEQIVNNKTGFIVENGEIQMINLLKKLLTKDSVRKNLIENLKKENVTAKRKDINLIMLST
ncbi:glycosyltransferase [Virgibacillus doumboii]|uniref:glycosyltransferase n=1 Tax=Virgibacillus doumboii TaxID=2697503 RepID=UPI0013E0C44B|nr:glycosyltransferase [Virgibacillus doumboii]